MEQGVQLLARLLRAPCSLLLCPFAPSSPSPHRRKSASAAGKLADLLRPAAGDVKWVAPENLHWTLQFLGDVDELEIPAVCSAVSTAVDEARIVRSRSPRGRGVSRRRSAATLWLGAGAGAQAMVALHAAIQKKLDRLGYRGEDRRFVPHITLGRAGRNAPPRSLVRELAGLAEFDAGSMLVDEVTVYASQLQARRPDLRSARPRAAGVGQLSPSILLPPPPQTAAPIPANAWQAAPWPMARARQTR